MAGDRDKWHNHKQRDRHSELQSGFKRPDRDSGNYGNLTFSNFTKTLPSSGTVSIAGTFNRSYGGHTITGSTMAFNGASAQTLPATFPTYNNLTINNASGVTLGGKHHG